MSPFSARQPWPRPAKPKYHGHMAIHLDDKPVKLTVATLDELLIAAKAMLADRGRMVVEVQRDGRTLSAKEIEAHRKRSLGQVDWALRSALPGELAVTTLREVKDLLTEARQKQEQAAGDFQADNAADAMRGLGEALEVWHQAPQAILDATNLMRLASDEVTVAGQNVQTLSAALVDQLRDLRQLVQDGDTVALADALGYEWPEITQRWQSLIDALIVKIESR